MSAIPGSCSITAQPRINEINQRIKFFEKKYGVIKSAELAIGSFQSSAALVQKKIVKVPSWFLFHCDDIPSRFRITGPDDPRIVDDPFLKDFGNWLNEKFREFGITQNFQPEKSGQGILQRLLLLLRDRDLFEKAKDFTLGHEMAHFAHCQKSGDKLNIWKLVSDVAFVIGAATTLFAFGLVPFVSSVIIVSIAGVGFVLFTGAMISFFFYDRSVCAASREEEKQADLDAARALQDVQGGIYYFDNSRRFNLAKRISNPSLNNQFDAKGNNLKDKHHPLLSERIAYLRALPLNPQTA